VPASKPSSGGHQRSHLGRVETRRLGLHQHVRRREIRKYIEASREQRRDAERGNQAGESGDNARIAQGGADDGGKHARRALVVVVVMLLGPHSLQRPQHARSMHDDLVVIIHAVDSQRPHREAAA